MALYHKYRPKDFDEIVGNEETIQALISDLSKDEKPHSILFYGPSGCGKTTLARIVAEKLQCSEVDFVEIDTADFRGIDTIRDIRMKSQYKPLKGSVKVWLLDECHKLSNDAQNALLKILEDTPSHVYFILATTDPQKLLSTVKGRCAQYKVTLLTDRQMKRLLFRIVRGEGKHLEKKIYDQIVLDSGGSPRNAIQILDQVLTVPKEYQLELARRQGERQSQVVELARSLLRKESWRKVSSILKGLTEEDPETIRRALLGYMSKVLLSENNSQAALVMEYMVDPFYNVGFSGLVFSCYSILNVE